MIKYKIISLMKASQNISGLHPVSWDKIKSVFSGESLCEIAKSTNLLDTLEGLFFKCQSGDIALGIINMIFETIGMMGIFAARSEGVENIVLTGNLSRLTQANEIFMSLKELFGVNFIIPENSQFATAIGAALSE